MLYCKDYFIKKNLQNGYSKAQKLVERLQKHLNYLAEENTSEVSIMDQDFLKDMIRELYATVQTNSGVIQNTTQTAKANEVNQLRQLLQIQKKTMSNYRIVWN